MIKVLACIVLLALNAAAKVEQSHSEPHVDSAKQTREKTVRAGHKEGAQHIDHKKLYMEMFKTRRRDHLTAVESILKLEKDKQRTFVEEILRNIKTILEESRETLDRVRYVATPGRLPDTETVKDSLSRLLENIAFFSDIALRFPRIVTYKLRDVRMKTVVVWAVETAKAAAIIDNVTSNVIHLMTQEIGILPKEEGFENPHILREKAKEEIEREATEQMKKRTEEKKRQRKLDIKTKKSEL